MRGENIFIFVFDVILSFYCSIWGWHGCTPIKYSSRDKCPHIKLIYYSFKSFHSYQADVTAQKLDVSPPINDASAGASANSEQQRAAAASDARQKRRDYVHAMISNRHCRVYCLLSSGTNAANTSADKAPEMEVFVEDTSGNGTLINGTTLLRRNERRRLHTGDVICLLNPKLLARKIRSVAERKMYVGRYSYVFVNLYEQEARHGWTTLGSVGHQSNGGMMSGSGGSMSNSNSSRKGAAVNVRATRNHSIVNNSAARGGRRSLFSSTTGANGGLGDGGMTTTKSNYPQQQLSSNNDKGNLTSNSTSGGPTTLASAATSSTTRQQRRRQSSASPGVEDIQTWQEDNKFLQHESVVYIIQQSTPVGGGGDRFELIG